MSYQYPLQDFFRVTGSGGGKGGGGGGKKGGGGGEGDPNTLRSKARARMLEIISEGPIVGLVDENGVALSGDNVKKAIFFDQTPVRNKDGTDNFKNVLWQQHKGLPDEGHFQGHSAVETPISVEVQVKKNTGPVQRTIVDENADAVRVLVRLPALARNDTQNGGLKKTSVSYAFEVRAYNGTWQRVLTNNINNQKTTSPFQIAHRINLPLGGSPWDLRMVRLTDDSDDTNLQNETWWEGYIVLVEGKFTYPNTAMVGLEVNAEDMGSSIPPRAYRVKGLIVQVPSNYNSNTRAYTGIWDGTFKYAWTDNPAWVFYDLLINDRYGLGEFVQPAIVDKWSLYTIAQYCDQLIPSGYKNGDTGVDIYEPRFTFNGSLNSRDEAYFVLQQISTAWRGMAYWSLGQVFATADMPQDPVKIVAPPNVINGEFNYSSTAIKARHSVIVVSWNDPNDFYRPSKEIVINQEMLNKYGWRQKDLQLTGCTSRGLAHRYGKWILDTEQNETETVEYQASWDHLDVKPGNIIAVADPRKAQIRLAGRLVEVKGTRVTLDYDFEPIAGQSYRILATLPDGSLQSRNITQFVGERELVVAAAFTQQPLPDAMFTIFGDVVPRTFRVLSAVETEPNIYKVTALFHDPNKFARVERNVIFDPLPYKRDNSVVAPPTNLSVREVGYVSNGQSFHSLNLSWSPPANMLNRGFLVSVVVPDGSTQILGQTMNPWFEMLNTGVGTYTFLVQTIGFNGVPSEAAEFAFEAAGPNGFALPIVDTLRLTDNPIGNEFSGVDLSIEWDNKFATSTDPVVPGGAPQHTVSPHYAYNTVRVYNGTTDALLRTARVTGERFVYELAANARDSAAASLTGPSRSLRVEITVHDVFGRTSAITSKTFTNPTPMAIAPTVGVAGPMIYLGYPPPTDPDFAGVMVWRKTSPGINVATDAPIYDGPANPIPILGADQTTYWFKVAAYDRFGKTGLNYSTEFSATTSSFGVDDEAPARPTGLVLTTRTETVDGVASRLVLTATVNAASEDDFAYFDYEIKQDGGAYISFPSPTPSYEWTVLPSEHYTVHVRAVDGVGNPSVFSATQSITTPDIPELATLINSGVTAIEANKIKLTGATMLSSWQRGGDETRIDGGALSANTVTANKMSIGQRGVQLDGLEFEFNSPSANRVSWTAGNITYINDAGTAVRVAITAGNVAWSAALIYIYWVKGATTLSNTTVLATAMSANNIVLATYGGGKSLDANYGRTVIDGSQIKTGTVTTNQLAAASVSAGQLAAGSVNATNLFVDGVVITEVIRANSVSAGGAALTAGTVGVSTSNVQLQTFTLTPNGGQIYVNAFATVVSTSDGTAQSGSNPAVYNVDVTLVLMKNGTQVATSTTRVQSGIWVSSYGGEYVGTINVVHKISGNGNIQVAFVDNSPGTAPVTYTLHARTSRATANIGERLLMVQNFKR